jgi:hypothetical protein
VAWVSYDIELSFCQLVVLDWRPLPLNFPRPAADSLPANTFMQPGSLPKRSPKQATAGVWAAVAQAHALLALAAATAIGASGVDDRAWADAAGTRLGSGRGDRRRIAAGLGMIV